MASNRLEINVDRENMVPSTQLVANKSTATSSRVHSVKKQAFGELKNVLHYQNQLQAQLTPFKSGQLAKQLFTPSRSSKKNYDKENSGFVRPLTKKALDVDAHVAPIPEEDDFFYTNCSEQCEKSLEYMWEEKTAADFGESLRKAAAAWNLYDQRVYEDDDNQLDVSMDLFPDVLPLSADELVRPPSPVTPVEPVWESPSINYNFWDKYYK